MEMSPPMEAAPTGDASRHPSACTLPPRTASRRGRLAAVGVVAACAVACSLPFVAGAGAVAGVWAVASGYVLPAVGIAVAAGLVAWWYRRRRIRVFSEGRLLQGAGALPGPGVLPEGSDIGCGGRGGCSCGTRR